MGTSNWQQIPFCIDVLMKIAPSRVLDIGVGFGRWGIILREFCEVWSGRIFRDQWKIQIEGIEGFPRNINDYHGSFYNKIHFGDAAELLPAIPGPWSVVIFGDVLEHFTKEVASELLRVSLDRSDYIMINVPIGDQWPQEDAYGNKYERHLSQWTPGDFGAFSLVRQQMFRDPWGRPHGTFILSKVDPSGLQSGVYSPVNAYT